LVCIGVKDIYNTVTLDIADPTCPVSSTMFDGVHVSGCNTYTSINSITHVCFSYWPSAVIMTALFCHVDDDAYSGHGGLKLNCYLRHHWL